MRKKDVKHPNIFGYEWDAIQRAQQGAPLSGALPRTRTSSVACMGCGKFFFHTETLTCPYCGHIHTQDDAKRAMWPPVNTGGAK